MSRDEPAFLLIRAEPAPRLVRGNPALPDPANALPGGGWRFDNGGDAIWQCSDAGADCGRFRTVYYDPPLAAGYSSAIAGDAPTFASVLIPAPLPGGDADFAVESDGSAGPLRAGQYFDFTSRIATGVRSFLITGSDLTEGLHPMDPTGASDEVRMVPLVVNTDDRDGDGVCEKRWTLGHCALRNDLAQCTLQQRSTIEWRRSDVLSEPK